MEIIEKALLSIIKDTKDAKWIQTPFTINNHVYSTDRRTVIKVPKKLVGSFDECKGSPQAIAILDLFDFTPKKITSIKVQDLKSAVDKIPLIDEVVREEIKYECNECDGTGGVEWEYRGLYTDYFDCPVCDGSGIIKEGQNRKTDKKIKDPNYLIDINQSSIRASMIEELINIALLLGVDNIEVIHQTAPNKPIGFQVGVAQVIMMPFLKS